MHAETYCLFYTGSGSEMTVQAVLPSMRSGRAAPLVDSLFILDVTQIGIFYLVRNSLLCF
jgi:hypothetical protein